MQTPALNPFSEQALSQMGLDFNPFLADAREYEMVKKAMDAGYMVPNYSGGGVGAPLLRQDLTTDLFMQTFVQKHIKFWPKVYKASEKLLNTVAEATRQTSLGPDLDGWSTEGALGPVTDSEFDRFILKCRFLSFVREVTFAMGNLPVLGPTPDAVAKVTADASLHLMTRLERGMFLGDDNVNPYEVNGLARAAADIGGDNVQDMRGQPLDPGKIADLAVNMIEPPNLGFPTEIWSSFAVKKDLGKILADQQRYGLGKGEGVFPGYTGGAVLNHLTTEAGDIPMEGSVFLSNKLKEVTSDLAIGETYPTTPTVSIATSADAGSLFAASEYGTYKYKVYAVGLKGKSAVWTSGDITIDGTHNKATITITAPGADNVLFYVVARSKPSMTTYRYWEIKRVRQTYSVGAPANTVIVDMNEDLPDTGVAFMLENTPQVLRWRELMAFSRIPLAIVELKQRFAFAIFGLLMVTLPRRIIMFKNIGAST